MEEYIFAMVMTKAMEKSQGDLAQKMPFEAAARYLATDINDITKTTL